MANERRRRRRCQPAWNVRDVDDSSSPSSLSELEFTDILHADAARRTRAAAVLLSTPSCTTVSAWNVCAPSCNECYPRNPRAVCMLCSAANDQLVAASPGRLLEDCAHRRRHADDGMLQTRLGLGHGTAADVLTDRGRPGHETLSRTHAAGGSGSLPPRESESPQNVCAAAPVNRAPERRGCLRRSRSAGTHART